MIIRTSHTLLFALGLLFPLSAQTLEIPKKERVVSEEVQNAIDEFNRLKREAENEGVDLENEVKVVLPPPAQAETPEEQAGIPEEQKAPEQEDSEERKAVLVTGKPPEDDTPETEAISDEPESQISESPNFAETSTPEPIDQEQIDTELSEAETPEPPARPNEPGLEIRVESIRQGTGILEPEKINLRASFPAKPLATPPSGWLMEKTEEAPAIKRDVELQPGTVISLDIKPHVLVPDSDGDQIFAINEPGFIAPDKYRQSQTVSAILAKSVIQLDEDAKQLGNALSELQQILSSLPASEPKAIPIEEVTQ